MHVCVRVLYIKFFKPTNVLASLCVICLDAIVWVSKLCQLKWLKSNRFPPSMKSCNAESLLMVFFFFFFFFFFFAPYKDQVFQRANQCQFKSWMLCCRSLCCLAQWLVYLRDHHTIWQRSGPLWECRGMFVFVLHILKCYLCPCRRVLWEKDRWGALENC